MQQNVPDSPFLTVVVPTYNRAHLIGKTLASLLNQTYPHYEVIVVDDGSTDDTAAVVLALQTSRLIYHRQENAERAAARNTGGRLAKGDYLNFFDSDDLALPNHLEEAATLIRQRNRPEWFTLGYEIRSPQGKLISRINNYSGDLGEKLVDGNVISCNPVFVRRDIFLQHPFNEDRTLAASEDYELWLRLAAYYPLHYRNTVTSILVNHEARSVAQVNKKALIERQNAFLHYVLSNSAVMNKYGKHVGKIRGGAWSYVALHLAPSKKHRREVGQFLLKSIRAWPGLTTTRRFWAILKHWL